MAACLNVFVSQQLALLDKIHRIDGKNEFENHVQMKIVLELQYGDTMYISADAVGPEAAMGQFHLLN